MRRSLGGVIGILLLLSIIALSMPASAQEQQFTLTPSLSVSETYDDNIFPSQQTAGPTQQTAGQQTKKSDFITMISPGLALDVEKEHTGLRLSYVPTIVRYVDTSANDTVRHQAAAVYRQDLAEHLKFNFIDNYIKSEDPIETTEGIITARRTRNPYQRNDGEGRMTYLFGAENTITAGYRNSILLNTDPTLDDSMIQNPNASLVYWFDIHHGMELSYAYMVGSFYRNGGSSQSDFTGNSPGLKYLHRFSPQSSGYASYVYTQRSFENRPGVFNSLLNTDYTVHNMMVGIDHQFSPQTSVTAGVGYFFQERQGKELSGPSYNAYLTRTFQRGRFRIGGVGGWAENFLQAQNTGFVQYYSADASGEYSILEPLSAFAGILYRHDTMENDTTAQYWRGNAGLRWSFYRWYTLVLDYAYSKQTSASLFSYDDNRVMLTLSWAKPYKL